MKKNILFWISAVILIALISCTPQKRLARLVKHHPQLFDTITRIDTTIILDSVYEQRKELSKTELDSLLEDYCKDTVISDTVYRTIHRDRIKDRIIDRCNLPRKETVFLENGKLFITRDAGGTEYKLETIKETVYQDRIVYLPAKDEGFKVPLWALLIAFIVGLLFKTIVKLFNPLR